MFNLLDQMKWDKVKVKVLFHIQLAELGLQHMTCMLYWTEVILTWLAKNSSLCPKIL